VENVHKKLEASAPEERASPATGGGRRPEHTEAERASPATGGAANADRTGIVISALQEVGRPIFFSLLVITAGFLPVFTLEGTEGRLFSPLAWTKTFSMAFAALLSVTLVPPSRPPSSAATSARRSATRSPECSAGSTIRSAASPCGSAGQ
jgi:Cu(I)/Ag(I) efflux system membrane protein CusA/SilA